MEEVREGCAKAEGKMTVSAAGLEQGRKLSSSPSWQNTCDHVLTPEEDGVEKDAKNDKII